MNPALTNLQRFPISLMATHFHEGIDMLSTAVEEVRNELCPYSS